jgi:hypothetical protein
MSAHGGQPSEFHIHLDLAIHSQDSGKGVTEPDPDSAPGASERALVLLGNLQIRQVGLPRPPALAWERAAFCEVFGHPGPGQRIRRFLEQD